MRLVLPFVLRRLWQWQKVASRLQHPSPSRPWHPLHRPRRHASLPLLRRAVQPRPLAPRCPSRARLATAHLCRSPRPLSAPFPAWQQFPFPQAAVLPLPHPSNSARTVFNHRSGALHFVPVAAIHGGPPSFLSQPSLAAFVSPSAAVLGRSLVSLSPPSMAARLSSRPLPVVLLCLDGGKDVPASAVQGAGHDHTLRVGPKLRLQSRHVQADLRRVVLDG